eukprot:gene25197-biopygen5986
MPAPRPRHCPVCPSVHWGFDRSETHHPLFAKLRCPVRVGSAGRSFARHASCPSAPACAPPPPPPRSGRTNDTDRCRELSRFSTGASGARVRSP